MARRRRALGILATAVAIILVVGVGRLILPHAPSYRTEIGGLEAVPMADGSSVTLNTDSGIRVAITDTERRVDLQRGEAFFEVAKDSKRPFVVRAGTSRIIAVGTKFSVRREAGEVRVVVTEGRVRVETGQGPNTDPITLVSAGSVAHAQGTGILVESKASPDTDELLSWRRGFVVFHDTPIAAAAAELNRYNRRKIVIEDEDVAAIRIGGNFRATNAAAFIRILADEFPIHVEDRGEQIVLTSDPH
jgi:transmembrane sensor